MNMPQRQWVSLSGRLLGALFYYAPTEVQLESILDFFRQPDWQHEWQHEVDATILQAIQQGLTTEALDTTYQELFIGPAALSAPPWGSVYLDPESVLFGDSLLKLREFLRQHRVEFVTTQNEPEDHIGLMLLLSAYLAENRPELLVIFLSEHVFTWSTRYLQLLANQQTSVFYRGLALLTQATLNQWQQQLDIQVNSVRLYR
ncbi:TPA: Tat proofreading chaperone DmsD [Pasteurella multocida]|nr:Tat proofreading chaperone DmsD [Pasteurella multocida]MDC4234640.1 Tat proofreading chaperone DmsD [Pasteurella multocida]OIQ14691.1 ABC transporter ATP-binding protein [Pasteurella multocida subsp. multocida]PNW23153.1 ABC transporter ATP-binding protein [Pasteurella multocida subsp. multocida]QHZ98043.1 Tat proofreading chaperone DmsD [Pasteurella multocida]WND43458.1 Tat proofreading chaperone DmsD [Pasteurella multocida]